ncbi:hypothetical protein SAMN04489807_2108 [Microbacterium hydrocarbonoxydans]|uniref:Uncharacterized protein n=1 Tax=Microbacterium hydrocarbonoxydans TaxID=273678 RepID=A0A1H4MDF3_9MICO|nr:hypothetical protein SAMN04489807_2108 [Microbacterium hydrocarbonoxydans]
MNNLRHARTHAHQQLSALRLPLADAQAFSRRIGRARADELPTILDDAAACERTRRDAIATKYASLLGEARSAFLQDTGIAVQIAEEARANLDHQRMRSDPEAVKADAVRLHAQGAGMKELRRTLHTTDAQILSRLENAPEKPSTAPSAPAPDPRDHTPEPRPVIPSKKIKKWTPAPLAEGDARHGTPNGYRNYRCRCEPCSEAHRLDKARRRQEGPKGTRQPAQHGTLSKYTGGCRCDDCRRATTIAAREYRARRASQGQN